MNIKEALMQLDPDNDDQWTALGIPRMIAVETILEREVIRREVTNAFPEFNRETLRQLQRDQKNDAGVMPAPAGDLQAEQNAEGDDELQALRNAQVNLRAELKTTKAEISRLKKIVIEKEKALEDVENQIEAKQPRSSNQEGIMAFIQSQNNLRMKKALRRGKIAEQVDLADLDPRSALDRSMARKNIRGAQRPAPRQPAQV